MERLLFVCPRVLWFRRRPGRTLALPCGRIGLDRRFTFLVDGTGRSDCSRCLLQSVFARLYASDFLSRCRDTPQWRAKIRQVDQRKQQTRYPKNVHMCEERNETQDSDKLELQLVGLMRHALGQGMQPKEQNAEHQYAERQDDGHDDHKHVGFTRGGDERRQMVGGSGVKRISHTVLLTRTLV